MALPLAYEPDDYFQRCACSKGYIFVIEAGNRNIHIHTAAGEEIVKVTSDDIGLVEDEVVRFVGSGPRHFLHIALHKYQPKSTRIITFKIK